MFDQATIQLNETLYRERLKAAEAARQRRATWVTAPGLIAQMRQALGQRFNACNHRLQTLAPYSQTHS